MLEVEIEVNSPIQADLYFEPSYSIALKGLEIAEAVVKSSMDGKLFIPMENDTLLLTCLGPGMCIGRATPLPCTWEESANVFDFKAPVGSIEFTTEESEMLTLPSSCKSTGQL